VAAGVLLGGVTIAASGAVPIGVDRQQRQSPHALPSGDAPAFLLADVQPVDPRPEWRGIYGEVERCAGLVGDFDRIRWGAMEAPLAGPKGPTYAFTVGDRVVLVYDDTTYLRHEMLHHLLQVAGWRPHALGPGERHTIADLHPVPLFGMCTGGR
jgi:hypothetical protein